MYVFFLQGNVQSEQNEGPAIVKPEPTYTKAPSISLAETNMSEQNLLDNVRLIESDELQTSAIA